MDKKVLTIERAKWKRGGRNTPGGPTLLLNHQGFMCCLGFDALTCGVSLNDIINVGLPEDIRGPGRYPVYSKTRLGPSGLSSEPVKRAVRINDDETMSDEEREEQLIPVLKQLGWDEVVFV